MSLLSFSTHSSHCSTFPSPPSRDPRPTPTANTASAGPVPRWVVLCRSFFCFCFCFLCFLFFSFLSTSFFFSVSPSSFFHYVYCCLFLFFSFVYPSSSVPLSLLFFLCFMLLIRLTFVAFALIADFCRGFIADLCRKPLPLFVGLQHLEAITKSFFFPTVIPPTSLFRALVLNTVKLPLKERVGRLRLLQLKLLCRGPNMFLLLLPPQPLPPLPRLRLALPRPRPALPQLRRPRLRRPNPLYSLWGLQVLGVLFVNLAHLAYQPLQILLRHRHDPPPHR